MPTVDVHAPLATATPEVSVVLPCLNEADTIATCVAKAIRAMDEAGIVGEVVVADNGSTDGSQKLATEAGARVLDVPYRGYGNALMFGIASAKGTYVIMADADDSYDLLELPRFVEKLRTGHALVQGCRLPSGGGRILPGAMPPLHRWWGNPMFSWLARWMFGAPIHDIYCGMRGFTKTLYAQLDLRCTGMEFATEMIIKASLHRASIAEVPVTLHPDGRKAHPPHLRTFRDGWRTLRFLLMYSPRWLFFVPGTALIVLGSALYALALPGVSVFGAVLDAHTLLFASLAILLGHQAIAFALFTKVFALSERLVPEDPRLERVFRVATLERGLMLGGLAFLAGLGLLGWAVVSWSQVHFGNLHYPHTLRVVIPGVTLVALGFQTMLASFFLSILKMKRR